jgi:hypothetical protein
MIKSVRRYSRYIGVGSIGGMLLDHFLVPVGKPIGFFLMLGLLIVFLISVAVFVVADLLYDSG